MPEHNIGHLMFIISSKTFAALKLLCVCPEVETFVSSQLLAAGKESECEACLLEGCPNMHMASQKYKSTHY